KRPRSNVSPIAHCTFERRLENGCAPRKLAIRCPDRPDALAMHVGTNSCARRPDTPTQDLDPLDRDGEALHPSHHSVLFCSFMSPLGRPGEACTAWSVNCRMACPRGEERTRD